MRIVFISLTLILNLVASTAQDKLIKNICLSEKIEDIGIFLDKFEKAVMVHDTFKIMQFMDPEYISEQHDSSLKGSTGQFLNQFFCGNSIEDSGFACIPLNEIKEIERVEISADDEFYNAFYYIISEKHIIQTDWKLFIRKINRRHIYGLHGDVG